MKLNDKQILDFSGGLILDKSDLTMEDNQLKDSLNCDLDEEGRLKRRRGIQQYGDTGSGIFDNSFFFWRQTAGGTPTCFHLVATRAATSNIYRLQGVYNTAAVAVGDAIITVTGVGSFAGAGNININGDIIAYTGTAGVTFTGCTGILRAHPAYSFVTQFTDDGAQAVNGTAGVYFAVLNNLLYIQGRLGGVTYDGAAYTAVADTDEAAGLFATNYRERIYCAGSGAADAVNTRNGSRTRVAYTEAGDATDWGNYLLNFFDVEDDRGDVITSLKELNDTLLIFKESSIFSYDEVQLKQRLWDVGAYNHRVVQKVGELIYTFCPTGVWVTNGFSAQKISDPISKYIEGFQPDFDPTVHRVVINCCAGTFENKYVLYIGDIEEPESKDDIVLVYDTIKGNWTVHDGYKDLAHFASLYGFVDGSVLTSYQKKSLFAGDNDGKYFRLYDNRFFDHGTPRVRRGADIIPDTLAETQLSIQTTGETKFYDMGDEPTQLARVRKIAGLVEKGTFQISYRLDRGTHITDWISLGDFKATITERKLKENLNQGYRIAFKITSNTADVLSVFNGIILKERETLEQTKHGIKQP